MQSENDYSRAIKSYNQINKTMGGLKYYERTKVLIELIEKERTGSPTELAGRLGVTKRIL
jgi:hypothetical protein